MTSPKPSKKKTRKPAAAERPEAENSFEEEAAGGLAPSPELEEAIQEAADSVDEEGALLLTEEIEPEASEEEIGRLSAELIETRDRLLRLQADFENFRRRALKEREEIIRYGHENLVKDLLSTVDNLDRAIDHARASEGGDLESFLQGVELVRRELLGILTKHSVTEIEAQGKAFDPALHEAMSQVPDGSVEPNTVVDVLQKGYQLGAHLLRPARVVVAGPPQGEGEDEGGAGP